MNDWYQVLYHDVGVSYRAVKEGVIDESNIRGNLGAIVAQIEGHSNATQKILFNPIGMGIHDLSKAHRIYENPKQQGIGRMLPLRKEPFLG